MPQVVIDGATHEPGPRTDEGHAVRAIAEPPTLSIVIPTLNEEKLIAELLERFTPALRARHGIELIVSDGGSTDHTLARAEALADALVVHRSARAQTIAEGRNAGASVARGEVLLFINADVRLPDPLDEFLLDLRTAARHFGAATCRVAVHPQQAEWMDRIVLGTCNGLFFLINKLGIGMGRGECHAVRRTAFEAVEGYRKDLAAGEDFDLFNRLAKHFRKQKDAGEGAPDRIRFLWRWVLYEDPRRYRQQGYTRTMMAWFANFLSITFRKRAMSSSWDPIR